MYQFTVDTPFQEIYDIPEVKPFIPYFIGRNGSPVSMPGTMTLREQNRPDPNRDIYAQCDGVNYLLERIFRGEKVLYDVYTPEEIAVEPSKASVKLLYFGVEEAGKPFVMLCPGGGYNSVCTVIEGLSTAQEFNGLGYPVFILNYRVGYQDLLPDPIDDVAAALRYIFANAEEFGVSTDHYAVGGFSAGGHLAAEWGTDNLGYAQYGLPKPDALFLVYPVIDLLIRKGREAAMDRYYGGHTSEILSKYCVNQHLWEGYPPSFLVHCKDDTGVPPRNSIAVSEGLNGLGIPNELLLGEYGGHGFGSGRSTAVEGWTARAAAFWEAQM